MTAPSNLSSATSAAPSRARSWYALMLLTLVYVLSQMDRNIVNILLDPIKQELGASDTQMGLLTGLAFVLFYSTLSLPVARLADRTSRSKVLVAGLLLWSAMTVLSGFATSFTLLALARAGVGVGEANSGASVALISEFFDNKTRPRALAIYSTAVFLGPFAALSLGGWVNQMYGWRAAFMVAGAPGLVIALVVYLTLADPPLGASEVSSTDLHLTSMTSTIRFLAGQKSYRVLFFNGVLLLFGLHAMQIWGPALLRRVHHLSSAEIGGYAGLMQGVLGVIASVVTGWLIGVMAERSNRWRLLMPAVTLLLASLGMAGFALAPTLPLCLACYGLTIMMLASTVPAVLAGLQAVVRVRMRSFATSAAFFVANLFGLGFGSLLIGATNDHLRQHFGDAGIRYSLLMPAACLLLAACLYALFSSHVETDMERLSGANALS